MDVKVEADGGDVMSDVKMECEAAGPDVAHKGPAPPIDAPAVSIIAGMSNFPSFHIRVNMWAVELMCAYTARPYFHDKPLCLQRRTALSQWKWML